MEQRTVSEIYLEVEWEPWEGADDAEDLRVAHVGMLLLWVHILAAGGQETPDANVTRC